MNETRGLLARRTNGFVALAMMLFAVSCASRIVVPDTCVLPPNLAEADDKKIEDFGAKVQRLTGKADGDLFAAARSTVDRMYPADQDINRIYALSYAACVSCPLVKNEELDCASRFDAMVRDDVSDQDDAQANAQAFRQQVLAPLRDLK